MSLRSRILRLVVGVLLLSAPVLYAHGSDDHGAGRARPFGDDSPVYDPAPGYDEWEAQDFPPHGEPYDSGEWNSDYDEPCIDHDGDAEAWPRLQAGRYRF